MNSREQILAKARELAPWHFDFELLPGLRTSDCNRTDYGNRIKQNVSIVRPDGLRPFFKSYYPQGLTGKTVLDVGCNAGAYCFLAHELGATEITGFDVRQHWIDQARFIHQVKYPDATNIRFELGDVKDYLRDRPSTFDIVIFKGVFYHLPDPISILYTLADAANEVILIDTASSDLIPEDCMKLIHEGPHHVMSGVDGIAWLPGGPKVIETMLRYRGFKDVRSPYWKHDVSRKGWGRFRVVGRRV